MNLQELEAELGPALRRTLDHVITDREADGHPPEPRGRALLLATVAAAVVVLVGGLLVIARRTDVPTEPVASTGSTVAASTTSPAVEAPPPPITWTRADNTGSIARSHVTGIVSGPSGFVATGMGFDDGRNQGRVWFSADGMTWEEPAFDLFDAKAVGLPAATSEAFYVVAATNSDRTPEIEGENVGALPDARLYRSIDGRVWEPWGDLLEGFPSIAATKDTLLRTNQSQDLEWSIGGLVWTPASFSAGQPTGLDLTPTGLISGERSSLLGFRGDAFAIWTSEDGRSWTELAPPPIGGPFFETPGGLTMLTNPDAQRCVDEANAAFEGPPESFLDALDVQWTCTSELETVRYDAAAGVWSAIPTAAPGPTPMLPPVARLGGTLVAPIIEPSKAMTVWTAHADTLTWSPDLSTTVQFVDDTGSPQPPTIAASDDVVVIASPDRLVDGSTVVLVGVA